MMAEAVGRYIDAQTTADVAWSFKDDEPDSLVVCFDEATGTPEYSSGIAIDAHGVQVVVRDLDYASARSRAQEIHVLLTGFSGTLWPGFPYVIDFQLVSAPQSMGRDNKDRAEWTAHYTLLIASENDAHRA